MALTKDEELVAEKNDNVNHPQHYTYGKMEVIDVIEAFNLGFREGNIVKYVLRHNHKNGLEDLEKARWYLNRLIEKKKNEQNS